MKRIILIFAMMSIGPFGFAETKSFKVKGMHCQGCVEMVDGEICDEKEGYKSCKVDLAKDEKNVGTIQIETTKGKKVDVPAMKKKLTQLNDKYELIEQ